MHGENDDEKYTNTLPHTPSFNNLEQECFRKQLHCGKRRKLSLYQGHKSSLELLLVIVCKCF